MIGTYLHGAFASDAVRAAILAGIAGRTLSSTLNYEDEVELALDRLAGHLARHLDIDAIWTLAQERVQSD